MINIKYIVKEYNNTVVLNIPELDIEKGETFGLVGNNGAGKTTLLSIISDLVLPEDGKVLIGGENVKGSDHWKKVTGVFIDESFIIGYLTAEEYFNFIGELRGMNSGDISQFLEKYHKFFNNEILNNKKYLRDFSKGNQKKVGIVAALMGNPELIILDEPFANLDPTSQIRLRKIIKESAEESGTTFIISSHTLNNIADVCKRIVILENGRIVKDVKNADNTLVELEKYFSVDV
jgi:ABC-2 type transport system ATP-binding protein